MKKIIFWSFICCLLSLPVFGEENGAVIEQYEENMSSNPPDLVYYNRRGKMPEIKELKPEEDDLYSGVEVKPLNAKMSEDEKLQNLSNDIDYIDKEYELPELLCNNPKLTKQVARFIQDKTNYNESSVKSRRNRLLMVKNLHDFTEINENDLNKNGNFKTKAALAHLRINENRKVYRICESKNNSFGQFSNVYLILYPYVKYYKVIVTNLISVTEKTDEAAFIYSW